MRAALYGPGGYYAERPALGGRGGDYFTSPELHPVCGALLGRQVAELWEALGRPAAFEIVEEGPGSGALCRDLLRWAAHERPEFARAVCYTLIEPSQPLRKRQQETLEAAGLPDDRIAWEPRSALMLEREVVGCVLANELVDAFPVHLVVVRDGHLLERYVGLDEGDRLTFVDGELSTDAIGGYFDRLGLLPGEGCIPEVNLDALTWIARTANFLRRGALLVLDYGYTADRLYAPERRFGTLLCYRAHTLSSDPLIHVGEQDITSHVDFTSLERAGREAGLETVGIATQARFLIGLGMREYLRLLGASGLSATEVDANHRAMVEMIDPDGLGAGKVLIQARDVPGFEPSGLGAGGRAPAPTWLPTLGPAQMRLPGPLELEGFGDVEEQWRELWSEAEERAD